MGGKGGGRVGDPCRRTYARIEAGGEAGRQPGVATGGLVLAPAGRCRLWVGGCPSNEVRIVAALLRCCVAALRRPQRASGNGEGGALRFWANYVPVPAAGCRPPARLGLAGPAGMLGLLLAADVGGEQVRSGLHELQELQELFRP